MIGKRLKGARAASGLSLRALSDAMENKVSAQAIGKYERNEDMPGSGVLLSLARALGISVDFLLSDDELELEGVEREASYGAVLATRENLEDAGFDPDEYLIEEDE